MRQLPLWQVPSVPIQAPPSHIFALADGNNFYVECERAFDLTIRKRPVIVLGNGDGCVVATSREAKSFGVKRGMPHFLCRPLIERYNIAVYSSNYPLYQEMSDRVMSLLAHYTPRLEVFSIDEAYLDFSHLSKEQLISSGQHVCREIYQRTGISLSLGIAPSKVLAKLGSEVVKRQRLQTGVFSFVGLSAEQIDEILSQILVEDLLGIGDKLAVQLNREGIITARRLKYADHAWLRHRFGVGVQRVALELRGICCMPLHTTPKPRKALTVSLAFGRPIEHLEELLEAISHYSGQVGVKLRQHHQQTTCLEVFIRTNPFDKRTAQYARSAQMTFALPTSYTPDLIRAAKALVTQIYRPGYLYKKAGVLVSALQPEEVIQPDLFGAFSWEHEVRQAAQMALLDEINRRYGRDTLFFAAQGTQRSWQQRARRRSPRYTTNWQEVLTVT
ncbi:umuC protein [Reticulibacter mediterranei]|uniref:UmuC protein n=1 Tax=Reticulibacter mediterranei TaxID=2778369 RepID=A0A8J3N9H9_9CHLR|nr:Y-family DNA polymerase [Reticulibacter mediterranei]GHP00809.1 umuC protein [Reticulibacter mediterranei]